MMIVMNEPRPLLEKCDGVKPGRNEDQLNYKTFIFQPFVFIALPWLERVLTDVIVVRIELKLKTLIEGKYAKSYTIVAEWSYHNWKKSNCFRDKSKLRENNKWFSTGRVAVDSEWKQLIGE